MRSTHNLRVVDTTALPTPAQVAQEIALSDRATDTVVESRREIQAVLAGQDRRKLVIVGPCSIHDPDAALEYARRLHAFRPEVADRLLIVMRVYFEKPRTTVGWKGLINDPHLDGSNDIPTGILLARRILLGIAELGLPAATELLDPIIPQYIADLISWTAIGARTTESQTHREMASGLSMPVGYKNGTDGNLEIAINAMMAAARPHSFLGIDADGRVGVVRTAGNPYGHVVLRGASSGTNYHAEAVDAAAARLTQAKAYARVLIDCNHGNSSKDYRRQPGVCAVVAEQIRAGSHHILGVMVESNLVEGTQTLTRPESLTYGQSITDACVDFETTRAMLLDLASAVG